MSITSVPAFHVSDISKASGFGEVFIQSRKDAVSSGVFLVRLNVKFEPPVDNYPAGPLTIEANLSDSIHGLYTATSLELINSYGKHNPTVYITGRCDVKTVAENTPQGCRYWLMIANNKQGSDKEGTPDVVGFAVHDRTGTRVAYGTGPLKSGDFSITPK
jgi:hypothetical protein